MYLVPLRVINNMCTNTQAETKNVMLNDDVVMIKRLIMKTFTARRKAKTKSKQMEQKGPTHFVNQASPPAASAYGC